MVDTRELLTSDIESRAKKIVEMQHFLSRGAATM